MSMDSTKVENLVIESADPDSPEVKVARKFGMAMAKLDFHEVETCYAADAVIWHCTTLLEESVADVMARHHESILPRMHDIGLSFRNVRVVAFAGGFVQEWEVVGLVDGKETRHCGCLVANVVDGKITRANDYYDATIPFPGVTGDGS